jgi:hypothetical protein
MPGAFEEQRIIYVDLLNPMRSRVDLNIDSSWT